MPRLACLLALAFTLVAGCTAPADADPPAWDAQGTPAAPAFTFEPARAVATVDNLEHEAFLAVSADGQVLLTCAHGEFKEPANMFASIDGGATFTEVVPPADAGIMLPAGDCEVALAQDGTWAFAGKTDVGIAVATTSDQGASWTVNNLAGPAYNGLADRHWLAYVGDALLMTYQPGTQQAGSVLFTRSMDHGATWTQPVEVALSEPGMPNVSAGDFVVAQDDSSVHFVVSYGQPLPLSSPRFDLLSSVDAGTTWTRQTLPTTSLDAYPSVPALGPDGTFTWAYQDLDGLVAIVSHDAGATWSDPIQLGTGIAWPRVWAHARPDGVVDVAWMSDGAHFERAGGLAVTRLDPSNGTLVDQAIVADIGFLEYAAVAHDGLGRAYTVVMDAPQKTDATGQLDGQLLLAREA